MVEGVAHEIRNPVTAIGGFARRLYDRLPDGTQEKHYAEVIVNESKRLEQMVKQIVEATVISIPSLRKREINEVVHEALAACKEKLTEGKVTTTLSLTDDLPPLIMDAGNLRRVIAHLISNAISAMPEGGNLTITTSKRNHYGQIQVTDTGIGIPPKDPATHFRSLFYHQNYGPRPGPRHGAQDHQTARRSDFRGIRTEQRHELFHRPALERGSDGHVSLCRGAEHVVMVLVGGGVQQQPRLV